MSTSMNLTETEQQFVQTYIKTNNVEQAAINIGLNNPKKDGSRWLRNKRIASAIKSELENTYIKEVTSEKGLYQQLAAIIAASPYDYIKSFENNRIVYKDPKGLTSLQKAAVADVHMVGNHIRLVLHDKIPALTMLERLLKLHPPSQPATIWPSNAQLVVKYMDSDRSADESQQKWTGEHVVNSEPQV